MEKIYHEEYIYNGKPVILSAVDLISHIEIMLLYPDGGEITGRTAYTAESALCECAHIRRRYLPDNEAPAPLTGKYAKLRDDLRIALEAGRQAQQADPEDGGACNRDSAAVSLPRWNRAKVKQAAKEAGSGCFEWKLWSEKRFVFTPDCDGAQGNARSRNAEAMTAALRAAGYDALDYCQLD
jgi:hypothetical protein